MRTSHIRMKKKRIFPMTHVNTVESKTMPYAAFYFLTSNVQKR